MVRENLSPSGKPWKDDEIRDDPVAAITLSLAAGELMEQANGLIGMPVGTPVMFNVANIPGQKKRLEAIKRFMDHHSNIPGMYRECKQIVVVTDNPNPKCDCGEPHGFLSISVTGKLVAAE